MITAQDIREKTFEKSKFGGYDMAEVDEFLEELADDITNTQKETSVLKTKMKVLVDKIEEYRSNESALNQAVLSAQKLAVQIEAEARSKADQMIADADALVSEKVGSITEKVEFEQKKLEDAQNASTKFLDGIRAMCNAQLRNIDNISNELFKASASLENKTSNTLEATAAEDTSAVDDTVRSIEASISRIKPETSIKMDISKDMDAPFTFNDSDSTQPFTL